jgi:mutator protein MutT
VTKTKIDVTAALLIKDGKVLAARRGPGKHLEGYWEFPGGKLEEGEIPENCLERELTEEFGISSRVRSYIGESVYDYGEKVVRLLGYEVEHISGDFKPVDHDELRWLGVDELFEVEWAPADIPLVQQYEARARTSNYYSSNATAYCEETRAIQVEDLYDRFLIHVKPGGHILDLGCGSGRDSKSFRERGYTVTSMDGNAEIASWAMKYTGHQVEVKNFQDIDYHGEFDGVWASASLLHCPLNQLSDVLLRVSDSLKGEGIAYMSFKWGDATTVDAQGRHFTNLTTEALSGLLKNVPNVKILEVWDSEAMLRAQPQKWVNAIIKKSESIR